MEEIGLRIIIEPTAHFKSLPPNIQDLAHTYLFGYEFSTIGDLRRALDKEYDKNKKLSDYFYLPLTITTQLTTLRPNLCSIDILVHFQDDSHLYQFAALKARAIS